MTTVCLKAMPDKVNYQLSPYERIMIDYMRGIIDAEEASRKLQKLNYFIFAEGVNFIIKRIGYLLALKAAMANYGICNSACYVECICWMPGDELGGDIVPVMSVPAMSVNAMLIYHRQSGGIVNKDNLNFANYKPSYPP